MKRSTLNRMIKMLEHAASHDETRYHLCTVLVTSDYLVAADGHILSRVEHEDSCFADIQEPGVMVSIDSLDFLKLCLKQCPKYLETIVVPYSITNDSITIDGKDVTFREGKFPHYNSLIPTYTDTLTVGFDVELLLDLVKSLSDNKNKRVRLDFKYSATKDGVSIWVDPIKVTVQGCETPHIGILMPCKV